MNERTLSIVKPDAVAKNVVGEILAACEKAGLRVVATKMIHMSKREAEGFYAVHKARPFFNDLTTFMSEGPVVVSVLEGDGAIAKYRDVLGATNPEQAAAGSVRKRFGTNIERNAAHGSDAPDTAAFEIGYFFNALELHPR
jgi:nucleoside-diphosphate kinase